MRAIQVRYLPPTTHRGARIKAFADRTISQTVAYDHALSSRDNARVAAELLLERLKWGRIGGQGSLPNGDYVFTLTV